MADDIVQVIQDAREDAVSLSQFIYYPASTMVERRLAPSIHTLNYYLDYLHGLELIYSQETGTVTVNGEEVKTVRQAINDSVDSVVLGEYQTQLEVKVDGLSGNVDTLSDDVSDLSDDVSAQKLDTGITATAKFGGFERTQASKNAETVSVEDFGASTSNEDNTNFINNAIAYCKGSGDTLLFPYEYAVSGNLVDLHDVNTSGTGSITRNGKKWHITPHGGQKNTFYVSATGNAANDGLDPLSPTTLQAVNTVIQQNIGSKASDGVWGLEMASGTYTGEGLRLNGWAVFKEKFQWHGADTSANKNSASTVIWDGSTAVHNLDAVLSQNFSSYLNIDFKYIYFKNWSRRGLCLWNVGEYTFSHCWFENGAAGLSYRYSFGTIKNCRFVGLTSEGIGVGYQATAMNGSLNAEDGNIFINCNTGANIGRNSTMYAQKNVFTNCGTDLSCSRMSRLRPQGNTHNDWLSEAYRLESGGVLTPDNGQGYPETYNNGNNKPVFYGESGSFHSTANRGAVKTVNVSATGEGYMLNTGTPMSLLTTLFSNANYAPFRIPSWTMLSPTYSLELKLNLYARAGYAGRIVLAGQGSEGGSAEIIGVDIPTVAENQWLQLIVEVYSREDIGSFIAFARIPELGITSKTAGTVNVYLGEYKDTIHMFRLYGSNTGTNLLSFHGLKSYVEL